MVIISISIFKILFIKLLQHRSLWLFCFYLPTFPRDADFAVMIPLCLVEFSILKNIDGLLPHSFPRNNFPHPAPFCLLPRSTNKAEG